MERKPQAQWSRSNVTVGKIPHIRMDDGAGIEVCRKQAEATGQAQVSSL